MANKFDWWSPRKYKKWQEFKNDIDARFKEIMWAYNAMKDASNRFNKDDFKYYTKMLFENGKVFISKNALKLIEESRTSLFSEDVKRRLKNGEIQDKYLQSKTHDFKSSTGEGLRWEHVVPTDLIIDEFLKSKDCPNRSDYEELLKYGMVCIVTREEDDKMTSQGYRSKMPNGICFKKKPWARYQNCEIEVVNLNSDS